MNVVFSVCKRDNKTIFVLVSDGLLSHYIFLYFYFYFQLVHPRGCRIYLRSKVSNIMNINKHSKGLRLCGRGLGSFVQDKQVSLEYCGEFTVKFCVGLVHSGFGAHGKI